MPDDLTFDHRFDLRALSTLPPDAPLPMPKQVIQRRRRPARLWLRRLLRAAR